jgi:hypothetical protein
VSATSMSVISQSGNAASTSLWLAPRGSGPRRRGAKQSSSTVASASIFATHRLALGIAETVEGAGVEQQAEVRADPCLPKSRHVGQIQALEKGIEPELVSERIAELRGEKEALEEHSPKSEPSVRRLKPTSCPNSWRGFPT